MFHINAVCIEMHMLVSPWELTSYKALFSNQPMVDIHFKLDQSKYKQPLQVPSFIPDYMQTITLVHSWNKTLIVAIM